MRTLRSLRAGVGVCASGVRSVLKRLAAPFGITSILQLYEPLAMAAYRRKLRTNPRFREWTQREGQQWVGSHWAHEETTGRFDIMHSSSQLFELTSRLRARVPITDGTRVLDAGASDGLFLASLGAKHGIGLNILLPCARQIREAGFPSCIADIERLPFPDRAFDFVICCETLEHVPNPISTLNELLRVCDQRLFLTVPWLERTRINARRATWPEVEGHIFEFDEQDFAKMLSHTRARVVERGFIEVFPEPNNPVLRWWFQTWMYGQYFPRLQYYELAPPLGSRAPRARGKHSEGTRQDAPGSDVAPFLAVMENRHGNS